MDRRHFWRTALALSSSLLISGVARGEPIPCSPIKNIINLDYFKNLLNDPYNLVLLLDLKKGKKIQHILIKHIHLYFVPKHQLELYILQNIGYLFIPVLSFADGYIAHRHNVEINLRKTLIIRNIYVPANKIGSLKVTQQ